MHTNGKLLESASTVQTTISFLVFEVELFVPRWKSGNSDCICQIQCKCFINVNNENIG